MSNPVVHFEVMAKENVSAVRIPGGQISIAMFKDPAGNLIGLVRNQ